MVTVMVMGGEAGVDEFCIPCLEACCPSSNTDGDAEFCNICWTETLIAAPCVELVCGHFVHASCGRQQLKKGRPTARLTFGFMDCPVCRKEKALSIHPLMLLGEGVLEQMELAKEVETLAVQRLRADELPPALPKAMKPVPHVLPSRKKYGSRQVFRRVLHGKERHAHRDPSAAREYPLAGVGSGDNADTRSDHQGQHKDQVSGRGEGGTQLGEEGNESLAARALKKYTFYQCHNCSRPYFGGLVRCEVSNEGVGGVAHVRGSGDGRWRGLGAGADAGAEAATPAEQALADVKPEELLCGTCSASAGVASCSEHQQEFIEHKCYWCCRKVASFFCGGRMHFCDVCHLSGFGAHPKPCQGGKNCLFGGEHPPGARNGKDEFALGCGICRPKPNT
ncbi:unnamed protein product [Choristocarpus tenellus]